MSSIKFQIIFKPYWLLKVCIIFQGYPSIYLILHSINNMAPTNLSVNHMHIPWLIQKKTKQQQQKKGSNEVFLWANTPKQGSPAKVTLYDAHKSQWQAVAQQTWLCLVVFGYQRRGDKPDSPSYICIAVLEHHTSPEPRASSPRLYPGNLNWSQKTGPCLWLSVAALSVSSSSPLCCPYRAPQLTSRRLCFCLDLWIEFFWGPPPSNMA